MPVISIEHLQQSIKISQPLMGIDLGTKTIGISISDKLWQFAIPLETIERKKFSIDAEKLIALINQHNTGAMIIGLPLNMNGTEGPRAQSTRAFVRSMEQKTERPFIFWDERLSTKAVERTMIEMDISRKKRALRIDAAAASFILQGALDRLKILLDQTRNKNI